MTQPARTPIDQLILNAVERAAASDLLRGGVRLERLLVYAVGAGVAPARVYTEYSSSRLEAKWVRAPGGVDLAVIGRGFRVTPRALCEMKIDKLDESLWDAIKLATLRELEPDGPPAYLIYAAGKRKFEDATGSNCSALFQHTDDPVTWETTHLIERWSKAWAGLLKGSSKDPNNRNHPRLSPARICTHMISDPPFAVAGAADQEIRVLKVWAEGTDEIRFGPNGWPEGVVPVISSGGKARSAVPNSDGQFPKPMRQSWLDRNVPTLADADYRALIAELKRRGWRDYELAARVTPHRI